MWDIFIQHLFEKEKMPDHLKYRDQVLPPFRFPSRATHIINLNSYLNGSHKIHQPFFTDTVTTPLSDPTVTVSWQRQFGKF